LVAQFRKGYEILNVMILLKVMHPFVSRIGISMFRKFLEAKC